MEKRKIILNVADRFVRDEILYNLQKRYFGKFDNYLDRSLSCVNYLSDNRIAKIVSDSIHHLDGKFYELSSYCVMPNHVHMLIYVERFLKPLYRIMQSLKRFTARESNKLLNLSGPFWQEESYDHIVRNENELINITNYIYSNPYKAEIISSPEIWKWKYLKAG